MNRELMIERMTWPDIRTALDDGYTSVVIACGAVEQHGPHLPLFLDAEHGTALAKGIARRLGNALVAPTIRIGCSEEHLDFPGTISLQHSTFEAVCRDYCTSLARHGFRQIYLVPSHGGNFKPLAEMSERLQGAVGPEIRIEAFTDMLAVIKLWKQVVEEEGGRAEYVGGHADVAESSIMLALHPELVKQEAAAPGYVGTLTSSHFKRINEEGIEAISPNGILGNPAGMSESIGKKCIEAYVNTVVSYFRKKTHRPRA